jgi:hypothetical protein
MPEHLLDHPNIPAAVQHVRRRSVAQSVGRHPVMRLPFDLRFSHDVSDPPGKGVFTDTPAATAERANQGARTPAHVVEIPDDKFRYVCGDGQHPLVAGFPSYQQGAGGRVEVGDVAVGAGEAAGDVVC